MEREREVNETLARELWAKRLTRDGLVRDLERFARKVADGPPEEQGGRDEDDEQREGRRLRWWWLG